MKTLRVALIVLVSLVLLIILLIGALFTAPVQTEIAQRVLQSVNGNLPGDLRVDGIRVSWMGEIFARGIAVTDSIGQEVLGLDSLYVRVSLGELRRKVIHVSEVRAGELRAFVELDSNGTSNIERALTTRRLSAPDTSRTDFNWTIRVDTILLQGGETQIRVAQAEWFAGEKWSLAASGQYAWERISYDLSWFVPQKIELAAKGAVQLDNVSREFSGIVSMHADSQLLIPMPPPLRALGSLNAKIDYAVRADTLQISAEVFSVTLGSLQTRSVLLFPPETLAGHGTVVMENVQPARLLGDTSRIVLNGRVEWRRDIQANSMDGWQVRASLGPCRYGAYSFADANVLVSTRASTYLISGNANSGYGQVRWEIRGRGYEPGTTEFGARIELKDLDLHRLIRQVPDSLGPLNGHLEIAARGLDVEYPNLRTTLVLHAPKLGRYGADELTFQGRAIGDSILLDTLSLRDRDLGIGISGRGQRGRDAVVNGRFSTGELHNLQPALSSFDKSLDSLYGSMDGEFRVTASLSGDTLSQIRSSGKISLHNIRYESIRLPSADVVMRAFNLATSDVDASVSLRELEAGGQRVDSFLCDLSGTLDDLRVWAELWAKVDTFHLVTDCQVLQTGDLTRVVINSFDADIYGVHWESDPFAGLSLQASRVDVDGLTLRSEVGVARAAGTLQFGGNEDFAIELSGVNLGELARIFKLDIPTSEANVRVQLLGPDTALTGDISVELDSVVQKGNLLADYVSLHASVDQRSTQVDGLIIWFGDTLAVLNGEIPAQLSIDDGVVLLDSLPMQGEAKIFRQPLSRLNSYLPFGSSLDGYVYAQALFSGTPAQPQWQGEFAAEKGEYRDSRVGVNYREITIAGEFAADTLRIPRFEVTAGGKLSGSGWAVMAFPLPSELHLNLELDRFKAVSGAQIEARASGNLKVDGPLNKLRATGKIAVEEALYRITQSTSKQIEPVDLEAELAKLRGDTVTAGFSPSQLYETTAHELFLDIPGNCWIKGGGVNIELSGSIWLYKDAGTDPVMNGDIKVKQGRVEFLGREFRVIEGVVRFEGPLNNPTLDVVAMDRRFTDPDSITIRVFGTLENTQMELHGHVGGEELTPDQVVLAILRGPLAQQGSGSAVTPEEIQTAAVSAATGQLSGMIGQWAGLDVFEFKTGKGGLADLSSGSLEVGTYVTDRLFIRVVQPVQATQIGQDVSVEYRLLNWLKIRAQRSGQESSAYDLLIQVDWR